MPKNTTINTEPFNNTTTDGEIRFRLVGSTDKIAQRLQVEVEGRVTVADGTPFVPNSQPVLVKDINGLTAAQRTELINLLRVVWRHWRKNVSND